MKRALVLSITLVAVALGGCKKEKFENDEAPPEEKEEKKDEPKAPVAKMPVVDIKSATPGGDHVAILFRFDHLRAHGLAPAAESIIAPMPDYKRVFGATDEAKHGDLIGDVFSAVLLTTSDPRRLLATTLAATGPFKDKAMKAMLSYPGSGIAWSPATGGALGTISESQRFGWIESRTFLMPAKSWIILADRAGLSGLLEPAKGNVKPAGAKLWPSWLKSAVATEKQSRIKDKTFGDLLVISRVDAIPTVKIPTGVGDLSVPTPLEATIAAYANDGAVDFHGSMTFDSDDAAKRFILVANGARSGLDIGKVAQSLPDGSLEPIKKLVFHRDGKDVRWKTTATLDETKRMCAYSARFAARLMGY